MPTTLDEATLTVALIGKYRSPEVAESLAALVKFISDRHLDVLVEEGTALATGLRGLTVAPYSRIAREADVAVVVGGDGTMLNAARHLVAHGVPLVGVNLGRLGFMTDVSRESMLVAMAQLLDGGFTREERILLKAELVRDGEVLSEISALNDVVLSKGELGRMIEFELHVDGEFIYVLRADGMIVATPTGSTAYALSANGPILHPSVAGIAIVPLCPHGLSYRPITLCENACIELVLLTPQDSQLHCDGQDRVEVRCGDRLRIRRGAQNMVFLHPPGYSYFSMLREKLHWSATPKRST